MFFKVGGGLPPLKTPVFLHLAYPFPNLRPSVSKKKNGMISRLNITPSRCIPGTGLWTLATGVWNVFLSRLCPGIVSAPVSSRLPHPLGLRNLPNRASCAPFPQGGRRFFLKMGPNFKAKYVIFDTFSGAFFLVDLGFRIIPFFFF